MSETWVSYGELADTIGDTGGKLPCAAVRGSAFIPRRRSKVPT